MTTQNPAASVSSPTPIPERMDRLERAFRAYMDDNAESGFTMPLRARTAATIILDTPIQHSSPSNPPEIVPANPQQSGGDWRERCKVEPGEPGNWRVLSPTGTHSLSSMVMDEVPKWHARWNRDVGPGQGVGNHDTEAEARAALAKAPQPPDIKPDPFACKSCGKNALTPNDSANGCVCKPTPSPAPENSLSPSESRTGEWLPEGMTPVAKVCDDHSVIRDGLTGTLLDDRDSQWRSECERLTRENAQWKASQAKYDEALAQLDAQRDETDRLARERDEWKGKYEHAKSRSF